MRAERPTQPRVTATPVEAWVPIDDIAFIVTSSTTASLESWASCGALGEQLNLVAAVILLGAALLKGGSFFEQANGTGVNYRCAVIVACWQSHRLNLQW